jgi:hypothetical protein
MFMPRKNADVTPAVMRYLIAPLLSLGLALAAYIEPATGEKPHEQIELFPIPALEEGGRAVKLVYYVPVPVKVFWRFKTDFGADFLLTNKYIESHRLTGHRNNVYITETRYTHTPDAVFKWQTTIYPSSLHMTYILLNPVDCGQSFNHGVIKMEAVGTITKVTHISYFDFFGAYIWTIFPGSYGMDAFLRYTARWEQETIKRLLDQYKAP